jgi:hydrogenase maturation protease
MSEIVVIGLGSPLFSDEGIGIHLIREFEREAARYPNVAFIDFGTNGMAALHAISGKRKAIIIDCAFMEEPPGAIRRFTPSDVTSHKVLAGMSLHEGDLLQILELGKTIGEYAEEVIIFGIQPGEISAGEGLSSTLTARLGEYKSLIAAEIK